MSRRFAVIIVLCGAVCMSFAALFVRLIDTADGYQILAYRSITLSAMVALVACVKRRVGFWAFISSTDRMDLLIAGFLAIAFNFYVFALLNTSVASAMFILSCAPVIAALLAWLALSERPSLLLCLCMAMALVGVGFMVGDGWGSGKLRGNLYAVLSAACFAAMLVTARASRKPDVLRGTFLGGVFSMVSSAILGLTIGNGLGIGLNDLIIALAMGAFTIGFGIALVTWATPYLPAPEVGLLVLIESVAAPVWVWVFMHEPISTNELFGGVLILIAVALLGIIPSIGAKRARRLKQNPPA